VLVQDTADARGQQRFIGYDPNLMGKTDGMLPFYRNTFQLWIADHPCTSMGPGLISEQAFALHWIKTPDSLRHIHGILYRTCLADSVMGKTAIPTNPPTAHSDGAAHDVVAAGARHEHCCDKLL
jgi:hypothetical protein